MTTPFVFDGFTLELDEDLVERVEGAWRTYAPVFLPGRAIEVPTSVHARTLANAIRTEAYRVAARTEPEKKRVLVMEKAATALDEVAAAVNRVRGVRTSVHRLHRGDWIRVVGLTALKGLSLGSAYEAHFLGTSGGFPVVGFRLVDKDGRVTRHEVGPFRAASVHAAVGNGLSMERKGSSDLTG